MISRRDFIKTSAWIAGSTMLPILSSCRAGTSKSIGIQLYTLRDRVKTDTLEVLRQVSEIGFKELEGYSYANNLIFNMPYTAFNQAVNDLGMKLISCHYSTGFGSEDTGTLRNDWESAVADAKTVNQPYMVIPSLHKEEFASIDALKATCELLNKAGETCKKHGITLGFHNHAVEFKELGGVIPYDVMLEELDPSLVVMELDIYWTVFAGVDPLQYFERYPGRFPLWHVKDMRADDRTKNADVGSGTIDYKKIFEHAGQAGLKHFFLEQEHYEQSPVNSITNGFRYLNTIPY